MNVSPDLLERVLVALDAGEVLSLCERGELYGVQCVRIGVALAITPDGSVQVRWETDSQRPMRGHYIGPTLTDHPEVLTPEQVAWELRVLPPTPWPPAPEPGWNLGFPYNRYREGSAQDMAVNVLLRRELAESILLGRPLGDWATHRASLDRAARERRARWGIAEDRAATTNPRLPFAAPLNTSQPISIFGGRP